jgi:surface polysaccharide O-acyltransferase-like enzyme
MLDIAVNVTYPEHGVIADKSIGIYMLLLLILHFIAYDRAYKNRKKQGS